MRSSDCDRAIGPSRGTGVKVGIAGRLCPLRTHRVVPEARRCGFSTILAGLSMFAGRTGQRGQVALSISADLQGAAAALAIGAHPERHYAMTENSTPRPKRVSVGIAIERAR